MSTAAKNEQVRRGRRLPNCQSKNGVPSACPWRGALRPLWVRLPWVVEATEVDFAEVANATSIPTVLVDIWAPWCGACRVVSPMYCLENVVPGVDIHRLGVGFVQE
jgi:hypothetical protein